MKSDMRWSKGRGTCYTANVTLAPRRRGRLLTPLLAGEADCSRRAGFFVWGFFMQRFWGSRAKQASALLFLPALRGGARMLGNNITATPLYGSR